ncbi:hypothetical protein N601_29855 [Rhodococcus erythropolis DN1]|nr:hypothetical protein N601_29855 [Rhodococcus erythropolis DN1]
MRRRHESLEADFATPAGVASTPSPTPDDDDLNDPVVSSNVHLPTAIAAQLAQARTERRLTNGEFIIWAIEATLDGLNEFIHPGGVVGGRLFKAGEWDRHRRQKSPPRRWPIPFAPPTSTCSTN